MEIHPLLLFCIFSQKKDVSVVWQWLCTAGRAVRIFAKNYTKTFPYCPESMTPYSETSTELRKIIQSKSWAVYCAVLPRSLRYFCRNSSFGSRMSFQIIWKPGNFQGYPDTFKTIRKISRLSRIFPGYTKTFQTIQKISRLTGNFPGYPEIFQANWKLSRLSENFPDHP